MQILNRWTGKVLFDHECQTTKELVQKAVLSGADLSGAVLSGAVLRGAVLSDAVLRGADVPDLDAKILHELNTGGTLKMDSWHTCETTHCRAGWAVTLCPKGKEMESRMGTETAATLIYLASYPAMRIPDFYASNEAALADIKARAALAQQPK